MATPCAARLSLSLSQLGTGKACIARSVRPFFPRAGTTLINYYQIMVCGVAAWSSGWLSPGLRSRNPGFGCGREAARDGGPVIVVESSGGKFYPPAAALAGIELSQLIVVRVRSAQDEIWAVDQALRCPAVGSVVCWTERFDQRGRRRWQLSAEAGAGLGLLVCPERVRHEACWAEVRLLVEPLVSERGRRLRVEVLRCRGAAAGRAVELELDHETSALPAVVSPPTPATRRRSGA